jgi:hypothetical protein
MPLGGCLTWGSLSLKGLVRITRLIIPEDKHDRMAEVLEVGYQALQAARQEVVQEPESPG